MSYRYLDHITWADTAFEARGQTLEELFSDAAQATLSVMVREPQSLSTFETRLIDLTSQGTDHESSIAQLLHEFLEKLLFYKDADQLLMRVDQLEVEKKELPQGITQWHLRVHLVGEKIDFEKQELMTDVKAVTHHQFEVRKTASEWVATVVLDV